GREGRGGGGEGPVLRPRAPVRGARRHRRPRRTAARPAPVRAPSSSEAPRDRGGPANRAHEGGRQPVALRARRVALRQPAVQAGLTFSSTRMPGVAAEPGRGTCATTRPLAGPVGRALSFIPPSVARGPAG